MDTLTIVFTGLMIFDFTGHKVYPVPAKGHEYTVQIDKKTFKNVTSVEFLNLAVGASDPVQNFSLLSLPRLTGKNLDPVAGLVPINLKFKGRLKPLPDFDICKVGDIYSVTWQGVQWNAMVQDGKKAAIKIVTASATETVDLSKLPLVAIGNNKPGAVASHLPMYEGGVKEKGTGKPVKVPMCEEGDFKNPIRTKTKTPITCPPVSLQ